MRVLVAASMLVLLAGSTLAQDDHVQRYGERTRIRRGNRSRPRRTPERANKKSLSNIPDKGPTDPWGTVRGTDAPKTVAKPDTAAKPAKPKTKTGAANNEGRASGAGLPPSSMPPAPTDHRPHTLVQVVPGDLGSDFEGRD